MRDDLALYSFGLLLLIVIFLLGFSQIDDILGERATLFKDHYYIKQLGNCDLSGMSDPHNEFKGENVLIELNDVSALASKLGLPTMKYLDILGECKQKLFNVRSKRPRPHLDDKVFFLIIICLEIFDVFNFFPSWMMHLIDQLFAR